MRQIDFKTQYLEKLPNVKIIGSPNNFNKNYTACFCKIFDDEIKDFSLSFSENEKDNLILNFDFNFSNEKQEKKDQIKYLKLNGINKFHYIS